MFLLIILRGGVKYKIKLTSAKYKMDDIYEDWYTMETIPSGDTFDCSDITDVSNMFSYGDSLAKLDLKKFKFSNNITNMLKMFNSCGHLTTVDISSLDTSHCTNMTGMFYNCTALTTVIGEIDLSAITNSKYLDTMFGRDKNVTGVKFKNVPKGLDLSRIGIDSSKYTVLNYI